MQEVYRTEAKPVLLLAFALNLLGNCWPRQGLLQPSATSPCCCGKRPPAYGRLHFHCQCNAGFRSEMKPFARVTVSFRTSNPGHHVKLRVGYRAMETGERGRTHSRA